MKTFLFFFLFFFSVCLTYGQEESIFKTNHILVIDKTGSMVGGGSGRTMNIWNDVQEAVIKYIKAVPKGDELTIYTFAEELYDPVHFSIKNEDTTNDAINYIKGIDPDGLYTAIYNAMYQIFEQLDNSEKHGSIIYLFTDGENNVGGYSMDNVITKFKTVKGEFDHCYYVLLRNDLTIPDEVIQAAEENSEFDTKKVSDIKMLSPIVLKPKFLEINANIKDVEDRFDVEQRFNIIPETDNIVLKAKIEYDQSKCNLDLLNSNDLKILPKNNSLIFNFEFVGSPLNLQNNEFFPVKIILQAYEDNNEIITFQPPEFYVSLICKIGVVNIESNGWSK